VKLLEKFIREAVETEGFELVDLVVRRWKGSQVVEVYVDREKGVTVNECARLNRILWEKLEKGGWDSSDSVSRIDVSSPGADRPLRTYRDFARNVGRQVRMAFIKDNQEIQAEGTIQSADQDVVRLVCPDQEWRIPYQSIQNAMIRIQWK